MNTNSDKIFQNPRADMKSSLNTYGYIGTSIKTASRMVTKKD